MSNLISALHFEGSLAIAAAPVVALKYYAVRWLADIRGRDREDMTCSTEHREMVRLEECAAPFTNSDSGSDLNRTRILVVEDQIGLRDILIEVLFREGYWVDAVGSLGAARCALAAHSYRAVLLDVMLPDGNGYELLRVLKGDPSQDHVRVVVLSVLIEDDDYAYGYACGADDCIRKPFDFADLVRRVKRLC